MEAWSLPRETARRRVTQSTNKYTLNKFNLKQVRSESRVGGVGINEARGENQLVQFVFNLILKSVGESPNRTFSCYKPLVLINRVEYNDSIQLF